MMKLNEWIKTRMAQPETHPAQFPVKQGLYYSGGNLDRTVPRIHLRVDADHSGVLWVNANSSYYLNESAAFFAWCSLTGVPDKQVSSLISAYWKNNVQEIFADYKKFQTLIQNLLDGKQTTCDLCDLGLEREMPFSKEPSAPYRMDLALTYQCNNNCHHCYNIKGRAKKNQLTFQQWKQVIDRICEIGIPHVVFTGGEPTLYPHLVDLVAYAESKGLVTGMNTNGRRLSNEFGDLAEQLKKAGLDHVQVTLESANDARVHNKMVGCCGRFIENEDAWAETMSGLLACSQAGLYALTNTTLLRDNASPHEITELSTNLALIGVKTFALNALIYSGRGATVDAGLDESELPELLETAKMAAVANGQRFLWYTPTQYCRFNPIEAGLGVKHCTAARYGMCVEPDGSVLPCQSWYEPVGNILEDDWETIWNADLCKKIRGHQMVLKSCKGCELLDICGGGCPIAQPFKTEVYPQNNLPDCF